MLYSSWNLDSYLESYCKFSKGQVLRNSSTSFKIIESLYNFLCIHPYLKFLSCLRSVLQYSLNTFWEVWTDTVWLTCLYLGIIITKNYQRMYDSDYNALRNFFGKSELTPQFIRREITAIWKKFHAKSDKNIILHASIKISENLDINYLRWSKVAACNFVKNGLNDKCFFCFLKFLWIELPLI